MSKVITPDFTAPNAKTRNMFERMSRFDLHDRIELIRNGFSNIAFRTKFSLADQVLLHGLVSSHSEVEIINVQGEPVGNPTLSSLISISREVYGVQFVEEVSSDAKLLIDTRIRVGSKTSFAGKDVSSSIIAVNPLADWSEDELVQYVLDHEVPVNPSDMPGRIANVA